MEFKQLDIPFIFFPGNYEAMKFIDELNKQTDVELFQL